ncbi:MAG: hypothetical protein KDA94_01005 [Acidimicrobiales bacterium]|nr:hypothetical protein [Acidimicrobiales bacterium]
MTPCDVADVFLVGAAFAMVYAISGLWARRHRWQSERRTLLRLTALLLLAILVLIARGPMGCPGR